MESELDGKSINALLVIYVFSPIFNVFLLYYISLFRKNIQSDFKIYNFVLEKMLS